MEIGKSEVSSFAWYLCLASEYRTYLPKLAQAKNLYHKKAPSVTGSKVKQLQDSCPAARVVYCSATGCSEPRNMGYMTRYVRTRFL